MKEETGGIYGNSINRFHYRIELLVFFKPKKQAILCKHCLDDNNGFKPISNLSRPVHNPRAWD